MENVHEIAMSSRKARDGWLIEIRREEKPDDIERMNEIYQDVQNKQVRPSYLVRMVDAIRAFVNSRKK